ncbi:MAG: S8 family serine peptidase [Aureispira sp.]|nr:S8 family serine peptidase [Aureispira sp.]
MLYSTTKSLVVLYLVLFLYPFSSADAQRDYEIFWVSFKDKKDSPYSIFHPQEYLSPRALERRQKYGITIDETDLPISPSYVESVVTSGFHVQYKSKWLNGIAVVGKYEDANAEELSSLDFVKSVRPIGFVRKVQKAPKGIGERDYKQNYKMRPYFYGNGNNQIKMLNGHYLHKIGFQGQGMHIAVTDGGFLGMPETPAFDSLYAHDRILSTRDFVEGDEYVYESSDHGRNVMATMASNLPFLLVGTSPYASYHLLKTEDDKGEYVIEEYNWVAAVEYADSVGTDVINCSLGYYDFDDNDMDYAYRNLNGNTAPITIAADYAAQKGILVVTSAGNEGNGKWKHITAPADADSVLTVGAVDRDMYYAKFSSLGFKNRDNVKPNVMARGHQAVVATPKKYDTKYSFGTSFSAPIMAGMAASLWQALPQLNNMEIIALLEKFSNKREDPTTKLGFGVPDFFAAYKSISPTVIELDKKSKTIRHNHILNDRVDIIMEYVDVPEITVQVFNAGGNIVYEKIDELRTRQDRRFWVHDIDGWSEQPSGVYHLYIKMGKETKRVLLLKYS